MGANHQITLAQSYKQQAVNNEQVTCSELQAAGSEEEEQEGGGDEGYHSPTERKIAHSQAGRNSGAVCFYRKLADCFYRKTETVSTGSQ